MIRFITLYLGLIVGSHDVEVMVDSGVAAVELLVDNGSVARLDGEPWRARVDFGESITTHELVAVAYDSEGAEIDRTAQSINTPRPRAEAELLLEHDASGAARTVRLEWQSTDQEGPAETLVTLDGERLLELEPRRFGLPPVTSDEFHILQADILFSGGVRAHAELTFGGEHLAETSGELTAIVVSVVGRRRSLNPTEMAGWFFHDDAPLRVMAVEKGPVELLIVRSGGVANAVAHLEGQPTSGGRIPMGVSGTGGMSVPANSLEDRLRTALSLPGSHRLRLLEPRASKVDRGHLSFETFIVSPVLTRQGGVFWALGRRFALLETAPEPRITDAVAVAGLQAAMGSYRRAVVLVTAADAFDSSTLRPAAVIDYLRTLQVPLFVWRVGPGKPPAGWPRETRIGSYGDLKRAVRELEKNLARQRVIWLEESHDPRSVQLAESRPVVRVGDSF